VNLQSYLARLGDILHARQDIIIENLQIMLTTAGAILQARLRFYDHSALIIVEEVEKVGLRDIRRLTYKFHYQSADETLIFRYDDAPHHPHLPFYPHHKHIGGSVIDAEPPDLADVLREIDTLIYPANKA
jgi:hypothetical protein